MGRRARADPNVRPGTDPENPPLACRPIRARRWPSLSSPVASMLRLDRPRRPTKGGRLRPRGCLTRPAHPFEGQAGPAVPRPTTARAAVGPASATSAAALGRLVVTSLDASEGPAPPLADVSRWPAQAPGRDGPSARCRHHRPNGRLGVGFLRLWQIALHQNLVLSVGEHQGGQSGQRGETPCSPVL